MEERPDRIEFFARLFIFGLLLLTLYLLFLVLQPFLPGIAWAIFLATAFYPVYLRILRLLRGRAWLSAIVMTVLVAAVIVVPAITMISAVAQTVTTLVAQLPKEVTSFASGTPFVGADETHPILKHVAQLHEFLSRFMTISRAKLQEALLSSLAWFADILGAQTRSFVQNAFRTIAGFIVMICTMAVLFRHGSQIVSFSRKALPLRDKDREAVFERLQEMVRAIFYGVMLTALIQASLGFIGFLIVGIPTPLFFAMVMFFAALIPVGGTALVWAPAAFYLYTQDRIGMAFFMLGWGLLVVGMADNILRPIFISSRTRLHILLVFFGIFGGIAAFGLKGLFLGPLVITTFFFLLEVIRRDLFQAE